MNYIHNIQIILSEDPVNKYKRQYSARLKPITIPTEER